MVRCKKRCHKALNHEDNEDDDESKTSLSGYISAIFWLISLLLIAWPASIFICWIYAIFCPISVFFKDSKPLFDVLLIGIQLPRICAENMVDQVPFWR